MMKQNHKLALQAREQILKNVLRQFDIPNEAFSIGSPAEQRVCLEKNGKIFHVYLVERGMKFQESRHRTEYAAHLEVLHQLATTKEEYRKMCDTYKRELKERKRQLQLVRQIISTGQPTSISDARVGDIIHIYIRPIAGSDEHIQKFDGIILNKNLYSGTGYITVQHIVDGVSFAKKYSLPSPNIAKIETFQRGRFRRGKLYVLRHFKQDTKAIEEDA